GMTAPVLPASLGRLRELHPEGADALELMLERAWEAAPAGVAVSCRRRIRELIGAEAPAGGHDPAASAYLDLTEQCALSGSEVTDEQVDALRRLGGDRAAYDFVSALYVLDLSERLDLLAGATYARRPGAYAPRAEATAPSPAPETCALGVGPRVEIPGGGMS